MTERMVRITQQGRSGEVIYEEAGGRIAGWWEFGGGHAIAIVSMGSTSEWRNGHAWAEARRADILRFVADEVVRQKASGCHAEIDEEGGMITLYQGPGSASSSSAVAHPPSSSVIDRKAKAATFVRRYTKLKAMFGIVVLLIALVAGAIHWAGKKVLTVAPTSGVPLGACVRTSSHIASLIQSTDPHLPEITGRGAHATTSVSILLIPVDGGRPRKILIAEGLNSNQFALAKILGADGATLWFDVNGLGGVDLERMELLEPSEAIVPHVPKPGLPFAPDAGRYLSAGFIAAPGQWLGLHTEEELRTAYAPGKFVRRVVAQEDSEQMRRLYRGTLEAPVDDKYHRIVAMDPVNAAEYHNAAFLRMDDRSEPLRLSGPDGVLMIHTSVPGLKGTAIISRVDLDGAVRWTVDTALDRFKLEQILPGEETFAFVGTRIPVEGKVSEPLVVIMENATGRMTTHSLWQ